MSERKNDWHIQFELRDGILIACICKYRETTSSEHRILQIPLTLREYYSYGFYKMMEHLAKISALKIAKRIGEEPAVTLSNEEFNEFQQDICIQLGIAFVEGVKYGRENPDEDFEAL